MVAYPLLSDSSVMDASLKVMSESLALLGVLVLGASRESLQSWQLRHLFSMCTTLFIACSLVSIDGRSGLILILYECVTMCRAVWLFHAF